MGDFALKIYHNAGTCYFINGSLVNTNNKLIMNYDEHHPSSRGIPLARHAGGRGGGGYEKRDPRRRGKGGGLN